MTDFFKISSTKLPKPGECYRERVFSIQQGIEPSEAMAFGTVIHACIEHHVAHGEWPSYSEMMEIPGNYDDPGVSLLDFPSVWFEAQQILPFLSQHVLPLIGEGAECEVDTAKWGVASKALGVHFTGFIDMLELDLEAGEARITDWKTRSNFAYAPRGENFRNDVQLRYYAALTARFYGLHSVTVRHVNILRPSKGGPDLLIEQTTHTVEHLRDFWGWVREAAGYMANRAPIDTAPTRTSCWNYGGCPFADQCPSIYPQQTSPFQLLAIEENMRINSPQAPPEVPPTPWRDRGIVELKKITKTREAGFKAIGVYTVGQLMCWLDENAEGKWWNPIAGLGQKGAEDLLEEIDALRAQIAVEEQ